MKWFYCLFAEAAELGELGHAEEVGAGAVDGYAQEDAGGERPDAIAHPQGEHLDAGIHHGGQEEDPEDVFQLLQETIVDETAGIIGVEHHAEHRRYQSSPDHGLNAVRHGDEEH